MNTIEAGELLDIRSGFLGNIASQWGIFASIALGVLAVVFSSDKVRGSPTALAILSTAFAAFSIGHFVTLFGTHRSIIVITQQLRALTNQSGSADTYAKAVVDSLWVAPLWGLTLNYWLMVTSVIVVVFGVAA